MRFDEIYMYRIYMYEMKIPVNICLDIKQFSSLSDILFLYISIFHLTNTLSICGFILLSVFVMPLSTLSNEICCSLVYSPSLLTVIILFNYKLQHKLVIIIHVVNNPNSQC